MIPNLPFLANSHRSKFTWWRGALFLVAVSILGRLSGGDPQQADEQFESQKTPPWSLPPLLAVWRRRAVEQYCINLGGYPFA